MTSERSVSRPYQRPQGIKRLLIVEDDPDIVQLLTHYLEKEGYQVHAAGTGVEGLHAAGALLPDLLILDLMLPGMEGYEVCKRLRAEPMTAALPIMMLTARGDETERIIGMEVGADDYVTKPFSPKEVVARVKALLRRSVSAGEAPRGRHVYGTLTLDSIRHEVGWEGRPLTLTAKEFKLLEYLLMNRGRLVTRETLLTGVWGYDATVTTRTIDTHIRRLREKIPMLCEAIVSIKPYGYKLREEDGGL